LWQDENVFFCYRHFKSRPSSAVIPQVMKTPTGARSKMIPSKPLPGNEDNARRALLLCDGRTLAVA
jgi:hypothetical protein